MVERYSKDVDKERKRNNFDILEVCNEWAITDRLAQSVSFSHELDILFCIREKRLLSPSFYILERFQRAFICYI